MTKRIVIGGTDVTDVVLAAVDAAPPLNPAQQDQLRLLFAGAVQTRMPRQAKQACLAPAEAA